MHYIRLFTFISILLLPFSVSIATVYGQSEEDDTETATYTLTLSDDEVAVDEPITVEWDTDASDVSGDWIGFYEPGANPRTDTIEWVRVEDQDGTFTVEPEEPGTYEFRYFLDRSYELVATSEEFAVTVPEDDPDDGDDDPGSYSLTVDGDTFAVNEPVNVTWDAGTDDVSGDWIGVYEIGGNPRTDTLEWVRINARSGEYDVRFTEPGTYEYRYYLDRSYELAATSEEFTILSGQDDPDDSGYSVEATRSAYNLGEEAEVVWDAPDGANTTLDWIGLFRPGTSDRAYLEFEYVDPFSNVETLDLTQEGEFEFRYFKNNTFNQVATSDPITVGDVTSACTFNTSNIENYPPPNGPIVAVGDSITFGIGASPGENYVEELEDRLDINIVNAGVPADTTRDVLSRLEEDVLDRDPGTVIVFIGGNDELRRVYESLSDSAADRALEDELDGIVSDRLGLDWRQVELIPQAETYENIRTIVNRIQATGAVTILVGFDATIYNANIDDQYEAIAVDTGSFYVPNIYDDIFGRPSRMSDLIHPNDVGYDIIADRIQPAVECVI